MSTVLRAYAGVDGSTTPCTDFVQFYDSDSNRVAQVDAVTTSHEQRTYAVNINRQRVSSSITIGQLIDAANESISVGEPLEFNFQDDGDVRYRKI